MGNPSTRIEPSHVIERFAQSFLLRNQGQRCPAQDQGLSGSDRAATMRTCGVIRCC